MRTKIWKAVVWTGIALFMWLTMNTEIQSGFWRFILWMLAIVAVYNTISSWKRLFEYMDRIDKKRRKRYEKWMKLLLEEPEQRKRMPKHGITPCSKEASTSETEDKIKEAIRRGVT